MTENERREFDRRGEELKYLRKIISVKNAEIEELEKEIRRLKGEPEPNINFIRVVNEMGKRECGCENRERTGHDRHRVLWI